jgi:hypothetical protein
MLGSNVPQRTPVQTVAAGNNAAPHATLTTANYESFKNSPSKRLKPEHQALINNAVANKKFHQNHVAKFKHVFQFLEKHDLYFSPKEPEGDNKYISHKYIEEIINKGCQHKIFHLSMLGLFNSAFDLLLKTRPPSYKLTPEHKKLLDDIPEDKLPPLPPPRLPGGQYKHDKRRCFLHKIKKMLEEVQKTNRHFSPENSKGDERYISHKELETIIKKTCTENPKLGFSTNNINTVFNQAFGTSLSTKLPQTSSTPPVISTASQASSRSNVTAVPPEFLRPTLQQKEEVKSLPLPESSIMVANGAYATTTIKEEQDAPE